MSRIQPTSDDASERLKPLGRVLFTAGIVLIILRALSLTTRMPGLPAFWYANQPLWVVLGFGMTAIGWQVLWGQPKRSERGWRPSVPGRRFRTATLYVGEGCHLCDEAAAMLHAYQSWLPKIDEINIHSDPFLVDQFGDCIPVLMLDSKIRFRGKISEALLRRLIEGTAPVQI
jgi:hypothetical protein